MFEQKITQNIFDKRLICDIICDMRKRSHRRDKTQKEHLIPIYREKYDEPNNWEEIPKEEKEKPRESKIDFYIGFFV